MKKPPKLCHHKKGNYAFIIVDGKQVYLGKWGSEEAEAGYRRYVTEWANSQVSALAALDCQYQFTVPELAAAFLEEFSKHPGYSVTDFDAFKMVSKRLYELFAGLEAEKFGIRRIYSANRILLSRFD